MHFSGGLIPTFMFIRSLGLINTPWVMIVGTGVSAFNMIVARQFFMNTVPEELYEAAEIDGASHFQMFFTIALPLSTAIIAVMALFYGVGHWNAWFGAMIYLTNRDLWPLQLVLRSILIMNEQALQAAIEMGDDDVIHAAMARAQMAEVMKYALIFIASAPLLVAYPFIQRYFVKGVMIGSIKG
jgi:putative aldouronate transport system permease protein